MSEQSSSATPARLYARLLVYLANSVLILETLRLRGARVAGTDTPFLTLQSGATLAVVLLLTGFSLTLVHWKQFHHLLNRLERPARYLLAVGFLIISFGVLILVGKLLPAVQTYLLAFAAWLLLINLAFSVLLFSPLRESTVSPAPPATVSSGHLRPRLRQIVLLIFVSILLPLLVLEFGLRFWLMNFGTEQDRIAYVYSADDIRAHVLHFRGLPYVNYGLSPGYPGVDTLGYRGPEITVPRPADRFRIVALGGSTTYGTLLDDWHEAYPAQLEQILRDKYGYTNVEVINSGVPAYATWETLVNFEFRVLDLQPDLIIVYHAVNDLSPRALPPEYYTGIPGSAGIWRFDAFDVGPSTLYRYIAINLGIMRNPNDIHTLLRPYEPAVESCCTGLSDEETAARFEANPPIYFERNLRNLIAVAQANHVQVMLSSWAYYPDPTANGMNLLAKPYRQVAIAEENAVTERLASETGVAFYDLFRRFPAGRDYWFDDGMHLTASGAHEQASEYAAFLNSEGLIPKPGQ